MQENRAVFRDFITPKMQWHYTINHFCAVACGEVATLANPASTMTIDAT
jgi:hypothetical protein